MTSADLGLWLLGGVLLLAALSLAALLILLKRELQQAIADWKLGRSLMRQLDQSIADEHEKKDSARVVSFPRSAHGDLPRRSEGR